MSKPSTSVESRFWKFVKKDGDRCWLWLGARSRRGYGEMYIGQGKVGTSSRISWEIANGPIPDGLCVLHKCDNPPCVNPNHLFLGTHKDNIQDMIAKGRPLHVVELAESNRGEGNVNAKLTAQNVLEIKSLLKTDLTYEAIGRKFGVTGANISCIARGGTWKHVIEDN